MGSVPDHRAVLLVRRKEEFFKLCSRDYEIIDGMDVSGGVGGVLINNRHFFLMVRRLEVQGWGARTVRFWEDLFFPVIDGHLLNWRGGGMGRFSRVPFIIKNTNAHCEGSTLMTYHLPKAHLLRPLYPGVRISIYVFGGWGDTNIQTIT